MEGFTNTLARTLAEEFIADIQPKTKRVEIVGSLRRKKDHVKDIEVLVIPHLGDRQVAKNLFGEIVSEQWVGGFEDHLNKLLIDHEFEWDFDHVVKRNGPRYKRLLHKIHYIPLDLFITDFRRWAYQKTIRTGSASFSQNVVSRALRLNKCFKDSLLHNHPKSEPCSTEDLAAICDRIIELRTERELFDALDMEWVEPENR